MNIDEAITLLAGLKPSVEAVQVTVNVVVSGNLKHETPEIKHGTTRHYYNLCRRLNGKACDPCKKVQADFIKSHRSK